MFYWTITPLSARAKKTIQVKFSGQPGEPKWNFADVRWLSPSIRHCCSRFTARLSFTTIRIPTHTARKWMLNPPESISTRAAQLRWIWYLVSTATSALPWHVHPIMCRCSRVSPAWWQWPTGSLPLMVVSTTASPWHCRYWARVLFLLNPKHSTISRMSWRQPATLSASISLLPFYQIRCSGSGLVFSTEVWIFSATGPQPRPFRYRTSLMRGQDWIKRSGLLLTAAVSAGL